jgi:hypothetical protein
MTDSAPDYSRLDIVRFRYPLPNLAQGLNGKGPVRIVAIGSASTERSGEILPYPPRLEMALRARFPGRTIDVLNRDIGDQEAPEQLSRFETDIFAERPSRAIVADGTSNSANAAIAVVLFIRVRSIQSRSKAKKCGGKRWNWWHADLQRRCSAAACRRRSHRRRMRA